MFPAASVIVPVNPLLNLLRLISVVGVMVELPQRFPATSTAQASLAKMPTDCTGAAELPRKGRSEPSGPLNASLKAGSYGFSASGIPPQAPPPLPQLSPD